jgi:hypothetical protein
MQTRLRTCHLEVVEGTACVFLIVRANSKQRPTNVKPFFESVKMRASWTGAGGDGKRQKNPVTIIQL